jgi:hypothetical protein
MSTIAGSQTTSLNVIDQASAVAERAIQSAATRALRSGVVCGCRDCQKRASRTFLWAVAMLNDERQPEGSPAEAPQEIAAAEAERYG